MGELAHRTISKAVAALMGVLADVLVEYVQTDVAKKGLGTPHYFNDRGIRISIGLKK
jgi:hypothetical protein